VGGTLVLAVGFQAPPTGFQVPPIGFQVPHIGFQVPPIGFQVPPIGFQAPHIGFQVPHIGFQVLPIGFQVPQTDLRLGGVRLRSRRWIRVLTISLVMDGPGAGLGYAAESAGLNLLGIALRGEQLWVSETGRIAVYQHQADGTFSNRRDLVTDSLGPVDIGDPPTKWSATSSAPAR